MTEPVQGPGAAGSRAASARALVAVVTELGLRLVNAGTPVWADLSTPALQDFSRRLLQHLVGVAPNPPNCPLCSLELLPSNDDRLICGNNHVFPPD